MISTVNYIKLKHDLLKNFKNQRIGIEIKGIVNTLIFYEKTRITINKHKLILSTEDNDFIIEFLELKKIKFSTGHIELKYAQFIIILEL